MPKLMPIQRCLGRGFTLVELMVSLSVLAIMSALALPSFQTFMAENRAKGKVIELAAAIKTAQSEALRRNRQVVFVLTKSASPTDSLTAISNLREEGMSWATVALRLAGGNLSDPATEVVGVGGGTDGTADVLIDASTASVCFVPDGSLKANSSTGITGASCTTTAATFLVLPTRGAKAWRVAISPLGKIESCMGVGDSITTFSCS